MSRYHAFDMGSRGPHDGVYGGDGAYRGREERSSRLQCAQVCGCRRATECLFFFDALLLCETRVNRELSVVVRPSLSFLGEGLSRELGMTSTSWSPRLTPPGGGCDRALNGPTPAIAVGFLTAFLPLVTGGGHPALVVGESYFLFVVGSARSWATEVRPAGGCRRCWGAHSATPARFFFWTLPVPTSLPPHGSARDPSRRGVCRDGHAAPLACLIMGGLPWVATSDGSGLRSPAGC